MNKDTLLDIKDKYWNWDEDKKDYYYTEDNVNDIIDDVVNLKDKQLNEAIESCKNAVGSCEVESIDEALEYIKNYIK